MTAHLRLLTSIDSRGQQGAILAARPLVILWRFAPVAFVYDMEDTKGEQLPNAVAHAFKARGNITRWTIKDLIERLGRRGIYVVPIEYGDGYAGKISADRPSIQHQSENKKKAPELSNLPQLEA